VSLSYSILRAWIPTRGWLINNLACPGHCNSLILVDNEPVQGLVCCSLYIWSRVVLIS
jgi:hypothetical protein